MSNQTTSRVEQAANDAVSAVPHQKRLRKAALYAGGLILGALVGLWNQSDVIELMNFIATIFTRLFSFIAVPVIALSLLNTLSKLKKGSQGGRIFLHTISYTLLTTILAASLAAAIFYFVSPANVPAEMVGSFDAGSVAPGNTYYTHIISVVPNNMLQPFVTGNVLSVLLIAAAFGLGLATLPDNESANAVRHFLSGVQDLLFVLIHWLIAILPVGILAFTAQLVSQLQAGVLLGGISQYFAVVISSNLLQMFVILPALLLLRGLNPLKIARGMLPALMVALFSKSSAGTLPVTMASAEDNLKVDRRVSRFVLPICTTINMNGCAAFIFVTSIYLMQNVGAIDIGLGTVIAWILIATVAAVGNAGVPMGCFFLTLSLMSSMNVPVQLMGIILPVYAVIDMIETCLNVWSDSCVCNIVNKEVGSNLPEQLPEAA
ncbi:MAG: dicarboxylate/amino acid:cation symporter [Succinivibrio sp.]|nr:dicarboxylate/amino acid:cation symporter [Succinivibrio sp.]